MDNKGAKLTLLYTDAQDKMPYFKRKYYEQAFTKYCAICNDIYKEIDEDVKDMSEEDKKEYISDLAKSFVEIFETEYKSIEKKGKQITYITNHNTPLVVYTLPAILNYGADWSKELCDAIVEKWNKVFTHLTLSYGTYADIKGGFKTSLCYITTAVCDSLNMKDDCKELLMLKDYRDNYLINQENGEELIKEYYNIAPTIVKRINRDDDSSKIYLSLYDNYISKCLDDIENNNLEACKDKYINMVNELKEKYM